MKDIHPYLILQLQEEEWLVLQYRVLWRGGAGVIPSIGAANLELFETFKCMAHSLLRVNPLLFFFFFFLGGGGWIYHIQLDPTEILLDPFIHCSF